MTQTTNAIYPHLVAAIFGRPWAIHDGTMNIILDILEGRTAGFKLTQDEIESRLAAAAESHGPREGQQRQMSVAVLPIYGVISPRGGMMANSSGGTSVQSIRKDFRTALQDPDVDAIAFDIDSPGGAVDGIPELADEIFAARGRKPMTAVANTMAASGALWLAASADRIVASPSASLGSIGVMAVHHDNSERYAKAGTKSTLIRSSGAPYKNEAADTGPLSEDALAAIQADADHFETMFISHMAKGRGVSGDYVKSDYGQGRMLVAAKAMKAGLIDGIQTLEQAVQDLAQTAAAEPPMSAYATGTIASHFNDVVNHSPQRAGLATGLPFAERLSLATGELEALAGIARDRAGRRAQDGRPLSSSTLEHLSRLKVALDTLVTASPPEPQAVQVAGKDTLELMLQLYKENQ